METPQEKLSILCFLSFLQQTRCKQFFPGLYIRNISIFNKSSSEYLNSFLNYTFFFPRPEMVYKHQVLQSHTVAEVGSKLQGSPRPSPVLTALSHHKRVVQGQQGFQPLHNFSEQSVPVFGRTWSKNFFPIFTSHIPQHEQGQSRNMYQFNFFLA